MTGTPPKLRVLNFEFRGTENGDQHTQGILLAEPIVSQTSPRITAAESPELL